MLKEETVTRIFVVDNIDPDYLSSVLDSIEPKNTLFNIIVNQVRLPNRWQITSSFGILDAYGLDPKEHIIFTTDPEKGVLRRIGRSRISECWTSHQMWVEDSVY